MAWTRAERLRRLQRLSAFYNGPEIGRKFLAKTFMGRNLQVPKPLGTETFGARLYDRSKFIMMMRFANVIIMKRSFRRRDP